MTEAQRTEYATLFTEAGKVNSLAATETRKLTGEEQTSQAARYARMDLLKAQHDQELELAKRAFNTGDLGLSDPAGKKDFDQVFGKVEFEAGVPVLNDEWTDAQKASFNKRHRAALNHFLRTGEGNTKFAITSSTSALIPTSVLPPTTIRRNNNAFRAVLALTGYEPLTTTSTETFSLPVFDDTGNTGDAPAENATADVTADSDTSGSVSLGAALFSSKTRWFSNTLLNANGFDILAYVTPILQKSVDKKQESTWTTALIALAAATKTLSHYSSITYAELIAWEHTLPVAYRSDAAFILADSLYMDLRSLVDANGRPIMDLDPTNVFQSRIHGKPAVVSDYMQAMGTANNFPGAFVSGDAIKLRDVVPQRLTRYVNVPTQRDQTGYDLFANGDCKFVTSAVALLKCNGTTS
jgi:HK97 family phage major capsid protein